MAQGRRCASTVQRILAVVGTQPGRSGPGELSSPPVPHLSRMVRSQEVEKEAGGLSIPRRDKNPRNFPVTPWTPQVVSTLSSSVTLELELELTRSG